MKAIGRYADGLASSEYEGYANRLAALAGVGQTATGQVAAAGADNAKTIASTQVAAGNARASAYQNTGSAINTGINNLASTYLLAGRGGGGFGGGVPGYGLPGGAPLPMPGYGGALSGWGG